MIQLDTFKAFLIHTFIRFFSHPCSTVHIPRNTYVVHSWRAKYTQLVFLEAGLKSNSSRYQAFLNKIIQSSLFWNCCSVGRAALVQSGSQKREWREGPADSLVSSATSERFGEGCVLHGSQICSLDNPWLYFYGYNVTWISPRHREKQAALPFCRLAGTSSMVAKPAQDLTLLLTKPSS